MSTPSFISSSKAQTSEGAAAHDNTRLEKSANPNFDQLSFGQDMPKANPPKNGIRMAQLPEGTVAPETVLQANFTTLRDGTPQFTELEKPGTVRPLSAPLEVDILENVLVSGKKAYALQAATPLARETQWLDWNPSGDYAVSFSLMRNNLSPAFTGKAVEETLVFNSLSRSSGKSSQLALSKALTALDTKNMELHVGDVRWLNNSQLLVEMRQYLNRPGTEVTLDTPFERKLLRLNIYPAKVANDWTLYPDDEVLVSSNTGTAYVLQSSHNSAEETKSIQALVKDKPPYVLPLPAGAKLDLLADPKANNGFVFERPSSTDPATGEQNTQYFLFQPETFSLQEIAAASVVHSMPTPASAAVPEKSEFQIIKKPSATSPNAIEISISAEPDESIKGNPELSKLPPSVLLGLTSREGTEKKPLPAVKLSPTNERIKRPAFLFRSPDGTAYVRELYPIDLSETLASIKSLKLKAEAQEKADLISRAALRFGRENPQGIITDIESLYNYFDRAVLNPRDCFVLSDGQTRFQFGKNPAEPTAFGSFTELAIRPRWRVEARTLGRSTLVAYPPVEGEQR